MSALPPKFCPECGEEFVHAAQRCADCDVALVAEPPAAGGVASGSALPDAAELASLVRGGPWELERIARALAAEGVGSRIDAHPPGGRELAIYVRPAELDAARRALEHYRAASLPDAPAPGDPGAELEACPACGAALAAEAEECPDCGLPFAAD